MKRSQPSRRRTLLRIGLYIVLLALLVLLVTRSHASLSAAVRQIRQASPGWFALSVGAMAMSLPATAMVYRSLSPRPLLFWRTVLVQTAGFCVNKLLPSGSGAAGVSFLYLRANKLNNVTSGALVVVNNLLGLIGHFILFWILVTLQPSVLHDVHFAGGDLSGIVWIALAGVIAVIVAGLVFTRRWFVLQMLKFVQSIKPVVYSPRRLGLGLLYSMLITLCYTVTLWASAHAVGANITLAAAIIALSSSVLATSAIPSPGGIGVAELGAYGGLVAVGVNQEAALAAALLYRVCSFWLPLIVGSLALVFVSQNGYLKQPARKAQVKA